LDEWKLVIASLRDNVVVIEFKTEVALFCVASLLQGRIRWATLMRRTR